jgi:predicted aldo/keto reductase-like oxidoreductase
MNRRTFIKKAMLGMMGASNLEVGAKWDRMDDISNPPYTIRKHNILGRTDFRVSDIAIGAPENEAVLSAAFDAGVNYIDTGENYSEGSSERTIGRAIRGRDRKSIFITTKLILKDNDTKERILQRAQKCLERLNTDYIDCLMIHNGVDVKIVKNEKFHKATRQLKEEGKLRFTGISSHGNSWWKNDQKLMTETMEKVCFAAAEDGRFDVFLFIYNYLSRDMGERILSICQGKNIGTTLMKINPVHNYTLLQEEVRDMIERGIKLTPRHKEVIEEFKTMVDRAQGFIKKHNLINPKEIRAAALRFVTDHPGVHTVCCQMPNFEEMEHWLSLSGGSFQPEDEAVLAAYSESFGQFYCRHACGICEADCPERIPINTIMRYQHYFSSQGREKEAMNLYNNLSKRWGIHCRECQGYCQESCPYGVPVQGLLELAHKRLTLT